MKTCYKKKKLEHYCLTYGVLDTFFHLKSKINFSNKNAIENCGLFITFLSYLNIREFEPLSAIIMI